MARRRLRSFRISVPLAAAVAVALAVCPRGAMAQKAPFSTFQIRQAVAADANFGANEQAMIKKYLEYFFTRFQANDDLPGLRKDYLIIVRDIPKTKGHDYLNDLAYNALFKVFTRGKTTAIRYNAMLLLAELNENDKEITPLPKAFALLMQVLSLKGRPEFDYLKPAALVGLARVAEVGALPKDQAANVTGIMLQIVAQKDPPPGASSSAHNYLRRRAAQVLALMGSPGADGSVAKALEVMLTDPQASVITKCETARYIGMLKYPPAAAAEVDRLAGLLGHQAVQICDAEIGPVGAAAPGSTRKVASRRRIMYALDSSEVGLQGLYDSAERGSETQKFISGLRGAMESLLKTLSELDETKEADVATIVGPEIEKIKQMLNARSAAKDRSDRASNSAGALVAAGSNKK
jgi:hypothetical protein